MSTKAVIFDQVVSRGCGIDVHKQNIVATVRGDGILEECRTFQSFTSDLHLCAGWLKALNVTHVAMESTGVYWKPVLNILEKDFDIILVNARHIKNVPGQKTDRKDSAWITKLLLSGLLKGSFILPKPIRDLRDLYRYKRKLLQQGASERNRLHKVLEDANIKLSSVVTDVFGVTGKLIIEAIISGQNDPRILAALRAGPVGGNAWGPGNVNITQYQIVTRIPDASFEPAVPLNIPTSLPIDVPIEPIEPIEPIDPEIIIP
jgi:hypothetical protein